MQKNRRDTPADPAHDSAPHGSTADSSPAYGSRSCAPAPGDGVRAGAPMATRREFAAAAAATAAAAAASLLGAARVWADPAASDGGQGDADPAADPDVAGDGDLAADPGDGVIESDVDPTAADIDDAADADDATDASSASNIVTVDEDGNVHIINTYTDIIDEVTYLPVATFTLPVGCNVYADCDTRAAVVQANASNRPFTVVGCLDYATGVYTVVLPNPIGGIAWAPSEARCTDTLIAWVEIDNATDDWAFYAAPFSGGVVDTSTAGLVKLGEGNADWLPPQFAVSGSTVVWQVMPDPSGPYVTHYSHAYCWTLGAPSGTEVYESPGRFACAPSISAGILTITPRVKPDQGVYYGITALDLARNLAQVDQLVMPASVKPFFATRIGDTFAFSVEANYGYGGLLGTMGYYIGPGSGPFDYVAREPSAQVCYAGGRYIVKSQLAYFVIDRKAMTYARISSANACVDYGDYPATTGTVNRFVTYSAVKDSTTGIPNGVLVRIFSLI